MRRSALLILLLLVPLTASGQALDFEEAKKQYSQAFRPDRPAEGREEAVAAISMFDSRDAAKLLVSAVKRVQAILVPILEEKDKVDEQLARYMKGKEFDNPRKIDSKAMPTVRKLQKQAGRLQDKIDAEHQVFEAIEDGLAGMNGGTGLAYLQRTALFEGFWKARQMVAIALGVMGEESSTKYLLRALDDRDVRVITASATALGTMKAKDALTPLLRLLGHKGWEVRAAAIWSLGELGEKAAVGRLIEQIEKEEGRLREDCAQALTKLTGQKFGQSVDLWKKWWKEHAHEYGEDGKPLGGHGGDRSGDPGKGYYGIPIKTNRAIFILDVSGSMAKAVKDHNRDPADGELSKLGAAKKELVRVLKTFDPKGWFNVVVFNDLVKKWKEKMVRSTDAAKKSAIQFTEGLTAAQSTNIYDAMPIAFEVAGMGARDKHYTLAADTIFLVTTGEERGLLGAHGWVAGTDLSRLRLALTLDREVEEAL